MTAIEYDLLGVVGVRLLDADERDAAMVDRQLGAIRARLDRPADLSIRFVDRLDLPPLRFVDAGGSGWAGDAFVVLRSKHKAPARVLLPLDRIGLEGAEITIQRGAPAVPYLTACVNLIALANGALPLHAAAFVERGIGVLVTGWSKGGKTESLLAFVSRGAEYVGDEWVYVLPNRAVMLGLPEPIRIWDWQLDQLPTVRRRVAVGDRVRLGGVGIALAAMRRTPLRRRTGWLDVLERQRCVDIAPSHLLAAPTRRVPAPVDRVFFVGSHAASQITVRPVAGDEVARRMAGSLRYELLPLWTLYQEFRYAFPERRNELLERAPALQAELLGQMLDGRSCIGVEHPYPVDLRELHAAMRAAMETA